MDYLLDTHIALWWAEDPALLRPAARDAIADPANEIWASAASAWELAIKVRAGKLAVDVDALFRGLSADGIRMLGIGIDDGIGAASLDWAHRDPFDRMLVAQARRMGVVLLTRDDAILRAFGPRPRARRAAAAVAVPVPVAQPA